MKKFLMVLIAILMFGCDIDNSKITSDSTFVVIKPDTFHSNRYRQYKYNEDGDRINEPFLQRNSSIYIDNFKIKVMSDNKYFIMPYKEEAEYLEDSELYLFHTENDRYITFDPNMKTLKIELGKSGTEFHINSTIKSNW